MPIKVKKIRCKTPKIKSESCLFRQLYFIPFNAKMYAMIYHFLRGGHRESYRAQIRSV